MDTHPSTRASASEPDGVSRRDVLIRFGAGGSAPPDRFAFTVYFDPEDAPVNHGIFGPEFTFTGEMIAGKITIGPPIAVALSSISESGTPPP